MAGRFAAHLLLVLALPCGPAAQAARLGGAGVPVLVVDQWAVTDAQGRVRDGGRMARLRQGGSVAAGLALDWAPALDHQVDDTGLAINALEWRDPPLQAPGSGFGASTADWQPPDSLELRLSRLADVARLSTQAQAAGLAARLATALAVAGASDGWFNFRQSLPVAGQARQVSWSLHVAASGIWFAGTPAVDAPGTAVLVASYTSLAAASGLPSAVRYQDAGWLRWTLVDALGHTLPGGGGRDTHGAFDGDAGTACLLGLPQAAACDPREEGLAGLMARLGAAQADVTVTGTLQPVYAMTVQGQRYAVASLSVQRSLQGADSHCAVPPWRYTNDWQAAFLLEARRMRFARLSAGWQLLAQDRVRLPAARVPWKSLSVTLAVSQLAGLADLVIDPDSGLLESLEAYPAGLQDITASVVTCGAP